MKKGLIGAVLAAFVLVFASGAMATDVDFTYSGTIEFKISGSSAGGACSGLFGAGDVLVANNGAADNKAKFSYGLGAKYEINFVAPKGLYGGADVEEADWYGSYYGAKISHFVDALNLSAEYGGFNPDSVASFFKVIEEFREEKGAIKKFFWFPLQLPMAILASYSKLADNNRFYGFENTKGGEIWIRN